MNGYIYIYHSSWADLRAWLTPAPGGSPTSVGRTTQGSAVALASLCVCLVMLLCSQPAANLFFSPSALAVCCLCGCWQSSASHATWRSRPCLAHQKSSQARVDPAMHCSECCAWRLPYYAVLLLQPALLLLHRAAWPTQWLACDSTQQPCKEGPLLLEPTHVALQPCLRCCIALFKVRT